MVHAGSWAVRAARGPRPAKAPLELSLIGLTLHFGYHVAGHSFPNGEGTACRSSCCHGVGLEGDMRVGLSELLLATICVIAATASTGAAELKPTACENVWPERFPAGKPFVLFDPWSGLTLQLESDGRHMKATNRDGKLIWQRDILYDKGRFRFQIIVPPAPAPMESGQVVADSAEKMRQRENAELATYPLDRLGLVPDCMVAIIDHMLPSAFHGHYIRGGSGTHIDWLLDAKTGDLQMEAIN
jgi:hypothetical protein